MPHHRYLELVQQPVGRVELLQLLGREILPALHLDGDGVELEGRRVVRRDGRADSRLLLVLESRPPQTQTRPKFMTVVNFMNFRFAPRHEYEYCGPVVS